MRRLVVVAATAAALGTLGLTAAAQAQLEKLFGASGFVCSNAKAKTKTDLKNYGFLVTPLCGVTG